MCRKLFLGETMTLRELEQYARKMDANTWYCLMALAKWPRNQYPASFAQKIKLLKELEK